MRLAIALSLTAVATLAACDMEATPNPPGALPENACGADALQYLVGKPADLLEGMRFAAPTRIIRPDMAVTMDYSAERLNISIDPAQMISRVACG